LQTRIQPGLVPTPFTSKVVENTQGWSSWLIGRATWGDRRHTVAGQRRLLTGLPPGPCVSVFGCASGV